ncbi:ScbR family autoregulator-binding transcription factor [Streptomyces pratensis]|uniref:ScbR family autoregulator-binding transcription factor n=1 Tax=Streptomyces pratensis TaxID=1169025 RepID=UPI00193155C7|nr:ScbR family autoregulator-binding transcription factor [Streptomyces pratensis]
MARQQRAIRTRRIFLEAAAEVFDEHGYDAATIAAILDRAGLTRGALYFHFTSKEELARGVLQEAVTSDGVTPQTFKLQEWVDIALLLAYRLPREPLLSASIRLSVDPRARGLFGTRWPDWISLGTEILTEAKERGELLPHVDPGATSRLFVGAWTGVQLVTESMAEPPELVAEISALFELILPNNAVPGVLARLDTSPHRAARIVDQQQAVAAS